MAPRAKPRSAGQRWTTDRDAREIEQWAREHDLPYFDKSVHFPDFRLEYDRRMDIRLLVPRRFRKASALYRYAVRDSFGTPLTPSQVDELD